MSTSTETKEELEKELLKIDIEIKELEESIYDTKKKNPLYEALSWIILQQTKKLDNGLFIIQPVNNKKYKIYEMPDFNILPEKKQQIIIEYRGRIFNVVYKLQEDNNNQNNPQCQSYYKEPDSVPSIFLSIINNDSSSNDRPDVNAITEFISECNEGNWNRVQLLSDLNGLETVVLDKSQEILLKRELDSFVNDKDKPGTGKTTLINAISSYLSRDLYYLNLKKIKNDNDMSAAFSSVPLNQIIVLEDVDTQLNILYKRGISHPNYHNFISEDFIKENDDLSKYKDLFSFISLSNFLGCLDGQILTEGTTTNHIEHLDPVW
ncbi:28148_t:CDS:2 [Racocetra persica]|uniref:28148_t:CDS:1 n=1 Tax=Racocetra persica TaxID=160502 RepID=A0ACA9Q5J3_9GLOM|nr:28148_t:CDS:2 [Racocetra persica]